jgi:hypothetical protein
MDYDQLMMRRIKTLGRIYELTDEVTGAAIEGVLENLMAPSGAQRGRGCAAGDEDDGEPQRLEGTRLPAVG